MVSVGASGLSREKELAFDLVFEYNDLDAHKGFDRTNSVRCCVAYAMDINKIKDCVRADRYVYTQHAEVERRSDDLTFVQIEEALLNR